MKSPRARKRTSRKLARSTNGLSTTRLAIPKRAAAASATSASCWRSKDLGGKCADLNALYVGLARAAGLPARDVYGIRVAKSELGYKSLGASSEKVTKAQHCRAEVYLDNYGWVPVDPADVRKVVLEEPPGNRPLDDDMVTKARARLFGSWEMNWMAFNFAHDVALPGSSGAPVGILHVSAGGDGRWPARLPRPGWLQIRNHVQGNRGGERVSK